MKAKLFTIAIVAIIGIAVIGCKEDDTPEHVHDFGTAWVKNATQHWHECSCGEKSDVANHTWDWVETRPATTEADGEETETCTICGQTNGTRTIDQTEPTKKDFPVSFDFLNAENPDYRYNSTIVDERTNCGSQNLEELKVNGKSIVTIIENAIDGSFTNIADNGIKKTRFRNVFHPIANPPGVTIYVDNPSTLYKMKATDKISIYFHIDYLTSSPTDIQQKIFDAVTAMNTGDSALPYIAAWEDDSD